MLSIDSPSETTGTGSALFLDGQDAAMLRASIVDATGQVVHMATHNVSFSIVSGPGRVVGANNGDPACHEPNHVAWHSAYHGLVRGIIMVTKDEASSSHQRHRMVSIDLDNSVVVAPGDEGSETSIVVAASAAGLPTVQVSIPVSTDASASVMNSAAASAGKPLTGFFD